MTSREPDHMRPDATPRAATAPRHALTRSLSGMIAESGGAWREEGDRLIVYGARGQLLFDADLATTPDDPMHPTVQLMIGQLTHLIATDGPSVIEAGAVTGPRRDLDVMEDMPPDTPGVAGGRTGQGFEELLSQALGTAQEDSAAEPAPRTQGGSGGRYPASLDEAVWTIAAREGHGDKWGAHPTGENRWSMTHGNVPVITDIPGYAQLDGALAHGSDEEHARARASVSELVRVGAAAALDTGAPISLLSLPQAPDDKGAQTAVPEHAPAGTPGSTSLADLLRPKSGGDLVWEVTRAGGEPPLTGTGEGDTWLLINGAACGITEIPGWRLITQAVDRQDPVDIAKARSLIEQAAALARRAITRGQRITYAEMVRAEEAQAQVAATVGVGAPVEGEPTPPFPTRPDLNADGAPWFPPRSPQATPREHALARIFSEECAEAGLVFHRNVSVASIRGPEPSGIAKAVSTFGLTYKAARADTWAQIPWSEWGYVADEIADVERMRGEVQRIVAAAVRARDTSTRRTKRRAGGVSCRPNFTVDMARLATITAPLLAAWAAEQEALRQQQDAYDQQQLEAALLRERNTHYVEHRHRYE